MRGGGEQILGQAGGGSGWPPDPASALCVVRPLGLVAGLAGRHRPGLPEGLPQLPPGGPAGQPGAREGAAAGQAGPPRLLPGGEECRRLGAGRGARPPDTSPHPALPCPGLTAPPGGAAGGGALPGPACPSPCMSPPQHCKVSDPAHLSPPPPPCQWRLTRWAPALRRGRAGASSGLRACAARLSGGVRTLGHLWPQGSPAHMAGCRLHAGLPGCDSVRFCGGSPCPPSDPSP